MKFRTMIITTSTHEGKFMLDCMVTENRHTDDEKRYYISKHSRILNKISSMQPNSITIGDIDIDIPIGIYEVQVSNSSTKNVEYINYVSIYPANDDKLFGEIVMFFLNMNKNKKRLRYNLFAQLFDFNFHFSNKKLYRVFFEFSKITKGIWKP